MEGKEAECQKQYKKNIPETADDMDGLM